MASTNQFPPKKLIKYGVTILALAIIAFGAYALLRPKDVSPNYLTADVIIGDVEDSVMASGKIKAISSVDVGAQVSGEVTKLYVQVGDVVKQGDLIAQIDEVTQNNDLSNARANLEQSQASLYSAQASLASRQGDVQSAIATVTTREAELAKAQSYFNRLEDLLAIDAIAKKDYDDAAADVAVAKAALDSAKAALDNAYANVDSAKASIATANADIKKSENNLSTAETNLGYTTIRAPISGTVVAIETEQGTTVNANQAAPTIVTLADLSQVRINAQISEADVINIRAGMPAQFNVIGNPEQKFDAILTGIEPAPEQISDTSSVDEAVYYIGYLDVNNSDGKLRIDMTAQVNIIVQQAKNVLIIPSSAITNNKGKTTVRVLDSDGSVRTVEVVVGINNRVNAEIKSGLRQGDKIIIGESTGTNASTGQTRNRPPMM